MIIDFRHCNRHDHSGQPESNNGSFIFNIRYYGKEKRDNELPNYLISQESSSIDFVIDSIEPKFAYSKFGVTFLFLSDLDGIRLTNKKSLDDEYTPVKKECYLPNI